MIIYVSICDKHLPDGKQFVGGYFFEIDYPAAAHEGQMSFMTLDCPKKEEHQARPLLGKLLTEKDIPDPVRVNQP